MEESGIFWIVSWSVRLCEGNILVLRRKSPLEDVF